MIEIKIWSAQVGSKVNAKKVKLGWRCLQSGWRSVLGNKKRIKWLVLNGGEQSTIFSLINAHIANLILKFQGVALKKWRLSFQSQRNISQDVSKFCTFIFPNNSKWLALWCYIIFIPYLLYKHSRSTSYFYFYRILNTYSVRILIQLP